MFNRLINETLAGTSDQGTGRRAHAPSLWLSGLQKNRGNIYLWTSTSFFFQLLSHRLDDTPTCTEVGSAVAARAPTSEAESAECQR